MSLRCLLVPSTSADDADRRLAVGLGLCHRLEAHLRLIFVRPDAEEVCRSLPDVMCAAGVTARQIEAEAQAEAARSRTAFADFCSQVGIRSDGSSANLPAVFGSWCERVGVVEPVVALAGRVSDLIVINRPQASDAKSERIFDAAVFSSGRPTLVVPERLPDDLLRHVVIAWNGSLEAAWLVGHAMDLLHGADRVSILTVPSEPHAAQASADLEDYLVWHGIRAKSIAVTPEGESVGAALLESARRADATMLLMGAYTHSRLRQALMGGVTRHVLAHATVPVLMEH